MMMEPATAAAAAGPQPPRDFDYCACFCEENVFKLVERLVVRGADLDKSHVIFVSSLGKATPLWYQRAGLVSTGTDDGENDGDDNDANVRVVWWDYHVVLRVGNFIYDLDTLLPFPSGMTEYCELTFQPQVPLPEQNRQRFRLVPAALFLSRFASDRSHMAESIEHVKATFPKWPLIRGVDANSVHELPNFWDVSQLSSGLDGSREIPPLGTVLDRDDFFAWVEAICEEAEEEEESSLGDGAIESIDL